MERRDDGKETLTWKDRTLAGNIPVLRLGFDERFLRIWEFYLAYCEAAFEQANINLVQYTLAKPT